MQIETDIKKNRIAKVMITCAGTWRVHILLLPPNLAIKSMEIIEASVGSEAGVRIIQSHAREPVIGNPDQNPEKFGKFFPKIKYLTNVVLNFTSGSVGSPFK
jgi:hypothetical protein